MRFRIPQGFRTLRFEVVESFPNFHTIDQKRNTNILSSEKWRRRQ